MQCDDGAFGALSALPEEMLVEVLVRVGPEAILRSARPINKSFRRLTRDDATLWKRLCVESLGALPHPSLPSGHPASSHQWEWLWRSKQPLQGPTGTGRKSYKTGEETNWSAGPAGAAIVPPADSHLTAYEGDWQDGHRHGFGTSYHYTYGALQWTYRGSWRGDRKQGRGVQQWPRDGSSYDGDWEDGKKHGIGQYAWEGGESYEGGWANDEEHGVGTYRWASGDSYAGEWSGGRKHGRGRHVWGEGPWLGDSYEGDWRNDMQSGVGHYRWNDGRSYVGGWLDHRRHGSGAYAFPDGSTYLGEWRDGHRHGSGRYRRASDGQVFDGRWDRDVFAPAHAPVAVDEWDRFFLETKETQRDLVRRWSERRNRAILSGDGQ